MNEQEIIRAITFFSFGIERLLKYILLTINPVFALKNCDFKNAAPSLYKDKIKNHDYFGVTLVKPDADVVSLRIAMQRAMIFSDAVFKNKQLLLTLSNYRDVIAHQTVSQLDTGRANRLLARDAFALVSDICGEFSLSTTDFFGASCDGLHKLGQRIQKEENFIHSMKAKVAKYKKFWADSLQSADFIKQATDVTRSLLDSKEQDFTYIPFQCPACEQEAVARIEPDYDYDAAEKASFITGVFVDNITCYFCGLQLQDYEELNFVDANSILEGN